MIGDAPYPNIALQIDESTDDAKADALSLGEKEFISLIIGKDPQSHLGAVRTLVAMPAYNEESHIADVITGAKQYADLVLVVDDGSIDNTVAIATSLGAMVIRHEHNKGYGGALQTIFSTARGLNAEELVILDSDGQHDYNDIPRLLDELRIGNDVVIGSRFNGTMGEGIPTYRKIGMKVLDIATMLAGGNLEITDSQSGFRAYGKRAINVVNIGAEGMSAGSEILVQVSDNHLMVAEVPIRVRYDLEGTSSENPIAHGLGVFTNLTKLSCIRQPLIIFGIPGLLFAGIGIGTRIYYTYNNSHVGEFYNTAMTGTLSMLLFGLTLIGTGIVLHLLVQPVQANMSKGVLSNSDKQDTSNRIVIVNARQFTKNCIKRRQLSAMKSGRWRR